MVLRSGGLVAASCVVVACGAGSASTPAAPARSAPQVATASKPVQDATGRLQTTPAHLRFARPPVVAFAVDPSTPEGAPLFNVIVKTNKPLPRKAGATSVRADITVNGIGDPAPVTILRPRELHCYGLEIEGGTSETDVTDGEWVQVDLIVLSRPRKRLRAEVPARRVTWKQLADSSGYPSPGIRRDAGCFRR